MVIDIDAEIVLDLLIHALHLPIRDWVICSPQIHFHAQHPICLPHEALDVL
ncbi:unnamed protein product [Mycena citricolor]|uniref:Uncharacterized protein n=1 Tax=Mycena citricolor TaxID=2018698 RepID=A0AAD2Q508_9AGAR|nr:unnamed protein product [Mycena citricolor]CAK5282912.1 unnamed protein product [Mycena citricolor]CAK5282925.1 unnamed protein product [Mycena citricolor]